MATEEDNFDIDIYGDGGEDYQQEAPDEESSKIESMSEPASGLVEDNSISKGNDPDAVNGQDGLQDTKHENGLVDASDIAQKIASTDESTQDPVHLPKQAPQTQGLKRKDGSDDRFVDVGATTALFISELHWWVTDDDVRGWANQSQCEDELEDITFSEHKVNGKSKGQAYVLFRSPQAATAAKQKIESFGEGQQYTKKFKVNYTNPNQNPFRTLPKDGPMRSNNSSSNSRSNPIGFGNSGGMNSIPPTPVGFNMSNSNGGYRGNRSGGYNNRGGINNMSGYNRAGFQQQMVGAFQTNPMSGLQGSSMGGTPSYGGFQNRGGMMGGMRGGPMGMRGGRGGMNPSGMMGMPIGGMGMGGMAPQLNGMGMGMPQMGAALGMPGMQSSHTNPYVSRAGHHPPSTGPLGPIYSSPVPTRQYMSSAAPERRYSPSGTELVPSPKARVFPSNPQPPQGTSWATHTQYSSPATTITPTHFPSQPIPSATPPTPHSSNQSGILNRGGSRTGQAGFQATQAHYNPAFFPQQQQGQQNVGGVDSAWNPHGAKRTRHE